MVGYWGLFGLSGYLEHIGIGFPRKQRTLASIYTFLFQESRADRAPGEDCSSDHTRIDYSGCGTSDAL